MNIPPRLQDLLSKEPSLAASVLASLVEFEPWIKNSNLPFFSEYTNHGIDHIESVFNTAERLIKDEAWEVLTPADAATILLATLLHDSAMHITPDSFLALIDSQNTEYIIPEWDKKNWHKLWGDFLAEALRFDDRKLVALFGKPESIRVPPSEPEKMTGRDKKVVGEFIRRYHHRLAHEIALFGVPGPREDRIQLATGLSKDMAYLAGLVARSHGVPIRSCIPCLTDRYALREYKGVHAVFLMALLRIADYLQIEPQRAPEQMFKVTKLRSPLSKSEWDFHSAIKSIEYHDDPESLFVIAQPDDVKMFLKIKTFLEDFQAELDISWAVLGEVYGRFSDRKLPLLALKLRRIRSNLDEVEKFAAKSKYIPVRTIFTTADPGVLNLLVGPLYNNDCAFGIRELIQNAVDAVIELREFQKKHPEYTNVSLPSQKADIIVSLQEDYNTNTLWLTVSDCGIGMNAQIICDFFLRAGASFRESDLWRKEFTDKQGRSTISRSGRFGVGVLACFLIGDEITVSTRCVDSPFNGGIEFTASLHSDVIQLNRISRPVGTEIRIKVFNRLKEEYTFDKWKSAMDWYYLLEPSVRFEINGKEIKPKYSIPNPIIESETFNWRNTKHPDYQFILWSYVNAPALTCNGLKVLETKPREVVELSSGSGGAGSIKIPNIAVFDYDGNLPLNLQRTQLTEDIPFERELLGDVLKDFLSFVLVYAPNTSMADTSKWDFYQDITYPGIEIPIRQLAPWFCTQQGISLLDFWHFNQIGLKSAIVFFLNSQNELLKNILSVGSMPIVGLQWPPIQRYFGEPTSQEATLHSILLRRLDPEFRRIPLTTGVRILLSTGFLNMLEGKLNYSRFGSNFSINKRSATDMLRAFVKSYGNRLHNAPKFEKKKGKWYLFSFGNCPKKSKYLNNIINSIPNEPLEPRSSVLAEWYFVDNKKHSIKCSPISNAWSQIIRDPVIPYDPQERRKNLAHAFTNLAHYIGAHEKEKETVK